jgi:L-alanine-DL-glutamate epimerase-like enolase superfamily enzyme
VTLSPGALADLLGALPVRVSSVEVRTGLVAVDDYAGGRPTSVVLLAGGGHTGSGENVAFTAEEHADFAARAPTSLTGAAGRVGALLGPELPRYERAALEAALIDLAMRQAGASLATFTGRREASLRFVVSFAATPDPVGRIEQLRAAGYAGAFKIDVDPDWSELTHRALAKKACQDTDVVAILDFKGRGDAELARALGALFPTTILEDPPVGIAGARVARDAALGDARAVGEAVGRGEAVNLKAPRMGGPLELLRGLEIAVRGGARADAVAGTPADTVAYLGGMFELGVGRAQARQLAALYCGDAPNDLAVVGLAAAASGARVVRGAEASLTAIALDAPGFGGSADREA